MASRVSWSAIRLRSVGGKGYEKFRPPVSRNRRNGTMGAVAARESKYLTLHLDPQYVARPPVASNVNPVVNVHSLLAAKAASEAISAISPVRFMGILSVI